MNSKLITELKNEDAKEYFLEHKNYVNFDLPSYFDFSPLLKEIDRLIKNKDFKDICKVITNNKICLPKNYEKVNYTFLANKDGGYAWRPLELINPVLYVDLVNFITRQDNWDKIKNRFKDFKNTKVECISIPRKALDENSHKASNVKNWWEGIEQQSIKLALEYEYIFTTDITNCYGSIYTHAIDWALDPGGRIAVQADGQYREREKNGILGAVIDLKIRNMTHGQTNGIPQGSVLMDFIAEIILGYADVELTNELLSENNLKDKDFKILRFRDDYRIFVKDPVTGKEILKHLNSVLYRLGMQMNPGKTSENNDILLAGIKTEKLERALIAPKIQSYQKEAMRIYQLSKKYPNVGLISTELSCYYDRIEPLKYLSKTDLDVLISIFSMVAFTSPRAFNITTAIISLLLEMIQYDYRDNNLQEDKIKGRAKIIKNRKEKIIKDIHKKFSIIPNSSLIDVWLQRISVVLGIDIDYKDDLTKAAIEKIDNLKIWNFEWLENTIAENIKLIKISNLNHFLVYDLLPPAILRSEFELFRLDPNYNI